MPIYEYICNACNTPFEHLVRAGEEPVCPSCGKKRLTRLLSVPAGHVAGSTPAPCPAREMGTCGMQGCGGGMCGMD